MYYDVALIYAVVTGYGVAIYYETAINLKTLQIIN